jgi:hypothetical protein
VAADIKPLVTAWRKINSFDIATEFRFFKLIAPGADVEDTIKVTQWIKEQTKELNAISLSVFEFYVEPLVGVRVQLEEYITAVYEKSDADFLHSFGSKCLNKMTPGHNKVIGVMKELWDIEKSLGGFANLMVGWEDFVNKCRVLSIKWGIYTLNARTPISSSLKSTADTHIRSPLKSITYSIVCRMSSFSDNVA